MRDEEEEEEEEDDVGVDDDDAPVIDEVELDCFKSMHSGCWPTWTLPAATRRCRRRLLCIDRRGCEGGPHRPLPQGAAGHIAERAG